MKSESGREDEKEEGMNTAFRLLNPLEGTLERRPRPLRKELVGIVNGRHQELSLVCIHHQSPLRCHVTRSKFVIITWAWELVSHYHFQSHQHQETFHHSL